MNPGLSSFLSARLIDRRVNHRGEVLASFQERVSDGALSETKIRKLQNGRLCALLQRARECVPFYRDLIPPGGDLTPLTSRKVLGELPIVSRKDLQVVAHRFSSTDFADSDTDSTSGSTGSPFQFRVDRNTRVARESSIYWADSLTGWRYGERCAYLWGNEMEMQSLQSGVRMRTRAWMENRLYLNAYAMSSDAILTYHDRLSRFRPHLLIGYASALEEFARVLRERGVRPDYPGRAVVSSAEVLSPEARAKIETVMGVPVFNRYGCREFGVLATEDSMHDGLTINDRDVILEIDSSDPYTEPGRVIVTYLANSAMPFIRYDLGDVVQMQSGPIGQGRIARVLGREGEIIKTSRGRSVHSNFFSKLFRDHPAVNRFEVVQEENCELRIRIERKKNTCAPEENVWRAQIGAIFGSSVEIHFEYVDSIMPLPSGKRRSVTKA